MLKYIELKDTRNQFLDITGVPVEEFEKYLPQFVEAYYELYPSWKTEVGGLGVLTQMEDKLLLIWMYHKVQVKPSMLGPQFGLSPSQTDYWIDRLYPVLQVAFSKLTTLNLRPNCIKYLQALNTYQVEYG